MSAYTHRETLELICALGSDDKSQHGHAMSVKLARGALFGFVPDLSDRDWEVIDRNWPKGKPLIKRWLNGNRQGKAA